MNLCKKNKTLHKDGKKKERGGGELGGGKKRETETENQLRKNSMEKMFND